MPRTAWREPCLGNDEFGIFWAVVLTGFHLVTKVPRLAAVGIVLLLGRALVGDG